MSMRSGSELFARRAQPLPGGGLQQDRGRPHERRASATDQLRPRSSGSSRQGQSFSAGTTSRGCGSGGFAQPTFKRSSSQAGGRRGGGLDPARQHRINIWEETKQSVLLGGYTFDTFSRRHVPVDCGRSRVTAFPSGCTAGCLRQEVTADAVKGRPMKTCGSSTGKTEIVVCNKDCVAAAFSLHREGLSPFVMDAGNRFHFGGGYKTGAMAQEEELCRRSSLAVVMENFLRSNSGQQCYPFPNPEFGLHVSDVTFFRHGPDKGYQWSVNPLICGVGIVTAEDKPALITERNEFRLNPKDAQTTRGAIRTFFHMAKEKGHRSCVCVPLGCGAFRNPALHVAELFMDEIHSPEFAGHFEKIVFAVLDDRNAYHDYNPAGNFAAFALTALLTRNNYRTTETTSVAVFDQQGCQMDRESLCRHVLENGGQLPPSLENRPGAESTSQPPIGSSSGPTPMTPVRAPILSPTRRGAGRSTTFHRRF